MRGVCASGPGATVQSACVRSRETEIVHYNYCVYCVQQDDACTHDRRHLSARHRMNFSSDHQPPHHNGSTVDMAGNTYYALGVMPNVELRAELLFIGQNTTTPRPFQSRRTQIATVINRVARVPRYIPSWTLKTRHR